MLSRPSSVHPCVQPKERRCRHRNACRLACIVHRSLSGDLSVEHRREHVEGKISYKLSVAKLPLAAWCGEVARDQRSNPERIAEHVSYAQRTRISAKGTGAYDSTRERTSQNESYVGGKVLIVLLSSLLDERSECGDFLLSGENGDDMMHILCKHKVAMVRIVRKSR